MSAPSRGQVLGAFAAIYLLWGGTFLAIRYAVADVPPLLTIGIRCLGGAALLFAWLWVERAGGSRARRRHSGAPPSSPARSSFSDAMGCWPGRNSGSPRARRRSS